MINTFPIVVEILDDYDIYLFYEKAIRGGICQQISHRYAKSDEETKIRYYDANNLYGLAMIQPLPISKFQWIYPESDEVKQDYQAERSQYPGDT